MTNVTISDSVTSIGSLAFYCAALPSVIIPSSVTYIADNAFYWCLSLKGIYFEVEPPSVGYNAVSTTVYYLPTSKGWGSFFSGCPTALWKPQVQTSDGSFGVLNNQFGFTINWASGMTVVVEACTNPANPIWSPVATNMLNNGSAYFNDPQWTNYPTRFYRLRSP